MRHSYLALGAVFLLLLGAGSARAGLEFCNETAHTQSVSVGYQGSGGWTSEGWWNIEPGACATTIGGDLQTQHYYYRAEIDGGDFGGEGYYFCTTPEAYTIVGDENCESRGYDSEDFALIDTGPTARHFTFTLVDAGPAPTPASDEGLIFCNETDDTQSISIGYKDGDDWVSEGWWNIAPGECQTPVGGALKNRYYYYRAEIDGGDFDGQGYMFCTTPEAYTIIGDENCRARGYDSEDFAEIDTGPTATTWTATLVDPDPGPSAPGKTPETPSKDTPAPPKGTPAPPKGTPPPAQDTSPPSKDGGEFPTFERKGAPRPGE